MLNLELVGCCATVLKSPIGPSRHKKSQYLGRGYSESEAVNLRELQLLAEFVECFTVSAGVIFLIMGDEEPVAGPLMKSHTSPWPWQCLGLTVPWRR